MELPNLIRWESIDIEALPPPRKLATWCAANNTTEGSLAREVDYSRGTLRQVVDGLTSSAPLSTLLGAITGIPELVSRGDGSSALVDRGEEIRGRNDWRLWRSIAWEELEPYVKLTVWLKCNGLSLSKFAALVGTAHPTVRAVALGTKRAEPTRRRMAELTGIADFAQGG